MKIIMIMKNNNNSFTSTTTYVLTDGSTLKLPFVHKRDDFFVNPDLKSNLAWLPTTTESSLGNTLEGRSGKFEKYTFNFESFTQANL